MRVLNRTLVHLIALHGIMPQRLSWTTNDNDSYAPRTDTLVELFTSAQQGTALGGRGGGVINKPIHYTCAVARYSPVYRQLDFRGPRTLRVALDQCHLFLTQAHHLAVVITDSSLERILAALESQLSMKSWGSKLALKPCLLWSCIRPEAWTTSAWIRSGLPSINK